MIKHLLKKTAVIFIAVAMLPVYSSLSIGATQVPDTVRVGLYYTDSSVNTAQSIFDVSAAAGIQIGFVKDGSFNEILRENGSSALFVRKDAYYYNTGGSLKEFNPSVGLPESGLKYGPYHIRIGNSCPDAASACALAASYRQAGIQAYVAYADDWQVWAGFYLDEESAQSEMNNARSALGEVGFSIVHPSANRIVVTNSQYQAICIFAGSTSAFQLRPAPENDPPVINIKGKPYRGALEVKRLSNSDMTVINVVSMREYLYGNVPPEIGGKSPAEALKAQAVVSKMYAINNMGKHGKTGFDICATTHCQVYKGYSAEVASCNSAIDEVEDKIITYNGKPAEHIYYFASGGGSTEDVRNVWGSSYPYLVSVEDKYEKIYTWTKTLRASDVRARLPQLGDIIGIEITKTAKTGRVTQLAITGASRGEPVYYNNEKCRTLLGLNSQLYTITTDADVYAASVSYEKAVTASVSANASANASAAVYWNRQETISPAINTGQSATDATTSQAVMDATTGQAAADTGQATTDVTTDQGTADAATGASPRTAPAVPLPDISEPIRTQLGGKKVVTASGVKTLNGSSSNKITVLGAEGNVKKIAVVPETYTFTGKGWGHAVGMSQEGAIGMAKAGFTYDAIIMHYFQGTKVE